MIDVHSVSLKLPKFWTDGAPIGALPGEIIVVRLQDFFENNPAENEF